MSENPDDESAKAEEARYKQALRERGIEGDPSDEDTTEPGATPPTDEGPIHAPLIERTDVKGDYE